MRQHPLYVTYFRGGFKTLITSVIPLVAIVGKEEELVEVRKTSVCSRYCVDESIPAHSRRDTHNSVAEEQLRTAQSHRDDSVAGGRVDSAIREIRVVEVSEICACRTKTS